MSKKNETGYLSAKESRRISRENRRITDQLEKRHKRKNVPESEYLTQMKDPNNALEIENLHTYFFSDVGTVRAVDGVSFDVPIGKTVGVVGESGCGKSVTSLSIMQLLQRPQGQIVDGEIRLNLGNGKCYDITKTPTERMQNLRGNYMSMIFQEPMTSLNPVFRIGAQLDEVIALHDGEGKSKEEIKEQVQYSPATGKYKVYIIDEVHMLSIGAFNALLKTLEEPPEYVIFILATTEVHKIPITILSRCQRYDFHRITAATIKKQLSDLMEQEHVDTEDKALEYVARMADGSMRDALSLLDQCIAFYLGEKLTYDNVLEVLGTVDIQVYSDLLDMILSQDINGVMDLLEDVARQGREWSQFITDFLWYLRNLLLVGQGNAAEEALEVSTDQLKLLQEKAQQVEENTLIRYIRILSELLERIRYATSKRVLVEVEMMKMCRPQMEADTNSLADRVRQLEQQLEQLLQSGIQVQQAAQAGQNQIALQQEVKSEQDPVKQLNEKFPPAKVEELIELVNHWRDVKRNLSPQMKYCLQRATLSVNEEGTALRVLFPKEMNVESGYFLEEPERIEQLKQELSRQSGRDVELEVSVMNTDNDDSDMINLDCIHMDVKIED